MKRFAVNVILSLFLGFGLALALVWLLNDHSVSANARLAVGQIETSVNRPLQPAGGVITVCLDGVCDYDSIQAAVDAADEGDVIKVAAGVYTDVHSRPAPPGYEGLSTVNQIVHITKTVTIRGGYTTTNWAESDPVTNPTTLDAGEYGRVVFIAGDISPTIEGLRITQGLVPGYGKGIGVYIVTATATIKDNVIFNNTGSLSDGGGLYLEHSPSTLSGNTIISNYANDCGGLYLWKSDAKLIDNVISANEAVVHDGGGVCLYGSNAHLSGNVISYNTSDYIGGGAAIPVLGLSATHL